MANIVLNSTTKPVVLNTRSFVNVLKRAFPGQSLEEIQGQDLEKIDPDSLFDCIRFGDLGKANIGKAIHPGVITDILYNYLETSDAQLEFNEAGILQNVRDKFQDFNTLAIPEPYEFSFSGQTIYVKSVGIQLILSGGEAECVDRLANSMFASNSLGNNSVGGSRLEITHLRGFDKELTLQFPAHYVLEDEENIAPAILEFKVILPKEPKNFKIFECNVYNNQPTEIDIGDSGLRVPLGSPVFFHATTDQDLTGETYNFSPRLLDDFYIVPNPNTFGKILKVIPVKNFKREETKNIFTTLFDKDDYAVPVLLKINIKP